MDLLTRDTEMIECPHCKTAVRRGMIRCRDCGGVIADDFVLSDQVAAAAAAVRRCGGCGNVLEPGVEECSRCAGAMLDELLKGGPAQFATPGRARAPLPVEKPGVSHLRTWNRTIPGPSQGEPSSAEPMPAARGPVSRRNEAQKTSASDARPPEVDPLDYLNSEPAPTGLPTPAARRETARSEAPRAKPGRPEAASPQDRPETNDACAALILSLAAGDVELRCQAATALGALGNAQALPPLERLMIDPEIRVRRAAAEALIQLGHPKGKTLLEIANRTPIVASGSAAWASSAARASRPRGGGGHGLPLKVGGGVAAAAALMGGGLWFWLGSAPRGEPAKPVRVGVQQATPMPPIPESALPLVGRVAD